MQNVDLGKKSKFMCSPVVVPEFLTNHTLRLPTNYQQLLYFPRKVKNLLGRSNTFSTLPFPHALILELSFTFHTLKLGPELEYGGKRLPALRHMLRRLTNIWDIGTSHTNRLMMKDKYAQGTKISRLSRVRQSFCHKCCD